MGMGLLTATERKRTYSRMARRTSRQEITKGLLESQAIARRRALIIEGSDPETGEDFTLTQYHAELELLMPLTPEESELAHSTSWNIEYFADLAEELRKESEMAKEPSEISV
jgi:hypothetical protein